MDISSSLSIQRKKRISTTLKTMERNNEEERHLKKIDDIVKMLDVVFVFQDEVHYTFRLTCLFSFQIRYELLLYSKNFLILLFDKPNQ